MSAPLNRADLEAAMAGGELFDFTFFWGHTAEPGRVTNACLSQWFPSHFLVDGEAFSSAEQFMMAGKARLFGDEATRARILAEHDLKAIKALGREVRGYVDEVWVAARFETVVRGNVAKFAQAPALSDHLLTTGERVLVEAAPNDPIWGIGLGRDDPRALEPTTWRGLNLLGFALMAARAQLRASG